MIVFDENVPPSLAVFLRGLGQPAGDVRLLGLAGATDEAFLPQLEAGVDCVVTKDREMIRRPEIVAICQGHRLGMFFLPGANLTALRMCQLVIATWDEIVRIAAVEPRPFYARIPLRGRGVVVARRPGAL